MMKLGMRPFVYAPAEHRVYAIGHFTLVALAVAWSVLGMYLLAQPDRRSPILLPPCAERTK